MLLPTISYCSILFLHLFLCPRLIPARDRRPENSISISVSYASSSVRSISPSLSSSLPPPHLLGRRPLLLCPLSDYLQRSARSRHHIFPKTSSYHIILIITIFCATSLVTVVLLRRTSSFQIFIFSLLSSLFINAPHSDAHVISGFTTIFQIVTVNLIDILLSFNTHL